MNFREAYDAGRQRWPSIDLDEEEFAVFLGVADDQGVSVNAGDLFLACACAAGQQAAIEIAMEQYVSPVVPYLVRRGFRPELAEEVSQSLGEKMLSGDKPRIRSYGGSGDLGAWMRLAAYRMALDQIRTTRAEKSNHAALAAELSSNISTRDPEMMLLRTDCAAIMGTALEKAISELNPRQKTTLRLYYVGGLSIDRIAAMFHVHRATAARQIADIREKLLSSISRVLRGVPGLSESDRRSLDALGRSQISIELETLLRTQ